MSSSHRHRQRSFLRTASAPGRSAHKPDYGLVLSVLLLVVFGFIAIASATSIISLDLTSRLIAQEKLTGNPSNYYFFKSQLFNGLLFGLPLFLIMIRVHYRVWKKLAPWLFLGTLVLLIAVFLPGVGFSSGGASRWISVGPFFFHPAELAKITFLLYVAAWLDKRGKGVASFATGFIPFLASLGVVILLLLLQRDLGTLIVIVLTAVAMYFVAGAAFRHLALLIGSGATLLFLAIRLVPFRFARFAVFLNPQLDPQGIGFQINQALLAIGSGGLFGFGLGHSRQKFNFLPEVSGDSIFAVLAEELGLIRVLLILALFLFLAYKGYRIARIAPDTFGKFVATGITTWFISQAFINIAGITGVFPLTGIPLPFISFGGSALVITLIGAGLLVNISRYTVGTQVLASRRPGGRVAALWQRLRPYRPARPVPADETGSST